MASQEHQVQAAVNAMRLMGTRMSWELSAALLRAAGVHVSRGWEETIDHFVTAPRKAGTIDGILDSLRSTLSVHAYVGGKQVTWYDLKALKPNDYAAVRRWIRDAELASILPSKAVFDIVGVSTKHAELESQLGSKPRLVAGLKMDGKVLLKYFAVRAYTVRETVNVSALTAHQRAPLQEYFEVIGVKSVCIPCFDVAVFDFANDRLEIRVDSPHSMRSDTQTAAATAITDDLNRRSFRAVQVYCAGPGLVNMLGAVGKLYKNDAAGNVSLLGFVASSENTSSNNRGQIIRRRGQDLRKDKFHVGGKSNVTSIRPYTIGVAWPSEPEELSLELHGSVRMLYRGNGAITEADFLGCATFEHYDFLAGQLASHLKTGEAASVHAT